MSSPEEQNDGSSWDLLANELGLEPLPPKDQKTEAPAPNPDNEVVDIPEAAVVEVNTLVDGTLDVLVETKGPSIVEVIVPPPLPKPPVTKSLALEDRLLSEEMDSEFGAGLDLPPVESDSTPQPTKFVALVTPLPEESEPIAEPEAESEVETDTETDLEVEVEAEVEKGGKKKRRRRKKGGAAKEEPTVSFIEEEIISSEGESDVETADAPEVLDEEEETIIPSAIDEEMEAEISQPTPQWTVMSWVDLIATLHRPER